jgi:sterol desaturase/sphingolipid hydroxylase (fatty acid hydroxylase superfamily)
MILLDGLSRLGQLLGLRAIAAAAADGVTGFLGLFLSPESVARFTALIHLGELTWATVATLAWVLWLFVVIYLLELLTAPTRSPYTSKTFRQDVVYTLFYQGGFYTILIWAALANVLEPRLGMFKLEILGGLPGPVHWVLYWITVDFCTYWWHRLLHTWGPLWAFHSVHHSQEEMSFITAYRAHPVEQLGQNLIMVIPLLVLGIPTFRWLPLYVAMNILEGVQHTALRWRYGRAYYIFVSPVFHAVHHSKDPRHHNGNYAKILSLWDFLFGTGIVEQHPPAEIGVEGMPVPRTMAAQLLAPFQILSARARPPEPAAAKPELHSAT